MKKRKGNALLTVLIMLTALIIICTGLLGVSMASLNQSANYYNKNNAFYYANNILENIIYNVDIAADGARDKANSECFLPGGSPNLENADIKAAYDELMLHPEDTERYKANLEKIFLNAYKKNISDIFDGSGSKWGSIKSDAISKFEIPDVVDVSIHLYNDPEDLVNDPDWTAALKGNGNKDDFSYYGDDVTKYPRETVYVEVSDKKTDVKRYVVCTFEINPYGTNKATLSTTQIKRGYNSALDYSMISGRNLIAINNNSTFTINGDIYVTGTSNGLEQVCPSYDYGGIIAGMDSSNLNGLESGTINKLTSASCIGDLSTPLNGNILINGNAYVGEPVLKPGMEDDEQHTNWYLTGGFVKTIGQKSRVTINNDLYCHSIVTEEVTGEIQTADGSQINIVGDSYIADNVSLYSKKSSINIGKSLIGFEQALSDSNYNSSPSIVINDQSTKLNIGGKVILFGVAFVNGDGGQIYKTAETVSINPNFLSYSYVDSINSELAAAEEKYPVLANFSVGGKKMNMLDTINHSGDLSGSNKVITTSLKYLLKYIQRNLEDPSKYDTEFNMGNNVRIASPNLDADKDKTSFYQFVLPGNNNIYATQDLAEDSLKNLLKEHYVTPGEGIQPLSLKVEVGEMLKDKKADFMNKTLFWDKGLKPANGFIDYFKWDESVSITDDDNKYFIKANKDGSDISLTITDDINNPGEGKVSKDKIDGYNILLITKGNIVIDNQSSKEIKLNGNIIAGGDIIIKGNQNLSLNKSKSASLYFNIKYINECQKLYNFLSKGVTKTEDITMVGAVKNTVKTNIKILNRRQIVK